MRLEPGPGRPHYRIKILMKWFPLKVSLNPGGARNQDCGIPLPARTDADREALPDDTFCTLDNLPHGVAVSPTAQIVDRAPLTQNLQGLNVRACQVNHVNVVSNAGSARSRIIVTIHFEKVAAPCRRLQNEWNEM